MSKRKPKQTDISKALNYIRAHVPTANITDFLEVTPATVRAIASGKSNSKEQTRYKILELYNETQTQVKQQQVEYIRRSKDKTLSPMARSLAKSRANDLSKTAFTPTEATKRQTVIKEQHLPFITASQFLSYYSNGKNETQLRDELERFTERGKEMLVTNLNGQVLFSREPLLKSSRVHVRGIVYDNNFSAGIDQIVKDLSYMFDNNQTLNDAVKEGEYYFNQCFKGVNALEVNKDFLNHGQPSTKTKDGKERSRGDKYKDLSKWLAERLFLGVYLY